MVRGIERMDSIVNIRSRQIAPFNGQIDLFAQETERLAKAGYAVTIVCSDEERGERIREYLAIADVESGVSYRTGALGSLVAYATNPETKPYQPMHVNFGLVPPLEGGRLKKRERYQAYADRAARDLDGYLGSRRDLFQTCR